MKIAKHIGWFWALVPLAMVGLGFEVFAWWRDDQPKLQALPLWLGLLSVFGFVMATWYRAYQLARKAEASRKLLVSVLNTLDVGLEIWDADDRLLHYNKQINRLRIDFRTSGDIGKTFEELTRAKLQQRQIVVAIGREEEWLATRMQMRGRKTDPQLKEYTGDQWFRTHDQRTAEGYLVTSWVDVTDLVRKERELQDRNALLQQLNSMDPLTGLINRRRLDEVLAIELSRSERSGTPISLLMIDIDHFKKYNDHYGHVAGDECLRAVADVLRRCVRRAGETVARYGGEEFVVLLPGSDLNHAVEIAQTCITLLRQRAIEHKGSGMSTLTFSIGVANTSSIFGLLPGTFVNAADAAMYRAKMAGRAGYKVADQDDWEIDPDTPRTTPAELGPQ
ncbi:diguanylate cyclase [Rhodoferax sp. GW822-FHT02A01]|uniref:GGDEF domain-containing protein n=1 Tax=Rhodoferax sp. GW822-FHT02A01 TaxID=3141537 RepID=UPI00315CEEF4